MTGMSLLVSVVIVALVVVVKIEQATTQEVNNRDIEAFNQQFERVAGDVVDGKRIEKADRRGIIKKLQDWANCHIKKIEEYCE